MISVVGSYYGAVAPTPGLIDYWRLGEQSGPRFADGVGANAAITEGGSASGNRERWPTIPTRRPASTASTTPPAQPQPLRHHPADASNSGSTGPPTPTTTTSPSSSPRTSTKTTAASWSTPTRASWAASSASRSAAAARATTPTSTRPSAGAWHHYALRLRHHGRRRPAGHPLRRRQTGRLRQDRQRHRRRQLRQLDALLHVAQRLALFGNGSLDEVAIYNRALSPPEVAAHFDASIGKPPAPPSSPPQPGRRPESDQLRLPRLPPTPTAPSSNTNGTSTATAAMRPTPARRRPPRAPTRPPAT